MPIPQVNDRIKEAPAVMLRAVFAGVGQLLLAADKVRARAAESGWPAVPKGPARGPSRWHSLDESRGGTVPLPRDRATERQSPPTPGGVAATASAVAEKQPATSMATVTAGDSGGSRSGVSPGQTVSLAVSTEDPPDRTLPARSVPMRRLSGEPKPAAEAKPAAKAGAESAVPAKAKVKAATKANTADKAKPATRAKTAAKPKSAARSKSAAKGKPVTDTPPVPGYGDLTLPSLRARMRGFDVATLRAVLEYEKAHAHRADVITMFERRLAKVTAD